jgi:phage shock protein PspC (stress-responsive transcriptional regulator)
MNASDTSHEAEAQINDQIPNDQQATDQAAGDQPTGGSGQATNGGSYSTGGQPYSDWQPSFMRQSSGVPLHRPLDGRMVFGVCAGIARYLNIDVNVVRIVFAVLTVVGGAGIPVYIAGWLLLPEEGAEQSIASEFIGSLQGRSR